MSRTGLIVAGTAVAAALVILIVWLLVREPSVGDTVEVTRGDVEVTVETVGRVEVRDQTALHSPISTSVEILAVIPGDEVSEGDVLIQLDRSPFDELIAEAEAALVQAESALAVLEADGPAENASEIADRVAAQDQVDEAERNLERAEAALEQSMVIAPFDGTVISVSVEEGDDVGQGSELILIAELRSFELILDVDEVDLPLIERGAETRIVLEAYPDHVIVSEIYSIARQAEMVGGTTVFPATVRFDAQEGLVILPGMNAEIEITTEVREDVLLLPEGSFLTVGRRTFVDVLEDGDVERREIRTGVRSGGMVEVADGLEEGDEVVVP